MPLQHLSPACWRLCLLSTYTHFFSSFLFFSFKLSYLSHVIFFGYFPVILNCYEVHKGRPTTVDSHEQKMRPSATIILKFNVMLKVYGSSSPVIHTGWQQDCHSFHWPVYKVKLHGNKISLPSSVSCLLAETRSLSVLIKDSSGCMHNVN